MLPLTGLLVSVSEKLFVSCGEKGDSHAIFATASENAENLRCVGDDEL